MILLKAKNNEMSGMKLRRHQSMLQTLLEGHANEGQLGAQLTLQAAHASRRHFTHFGTCKWMAL